MTTSNNRPLTEDDIAAYLLGNPDFFERHADVLATVQLTSPHSRRAISLQERQAEILRARIRELELHGAQMLRHGQHNERVLAQLDALTLTWLAQPQASALPEQIEQGLKQALQLQWVALRVWDMPKAAGLAHTFEPSPALRQHINAMQQPYCGVRRDDPTMDWLAEPEGVASMACVPLRLTSSEQAIGAMVLASDDAQRFTDDMGLALLQRLGALVAAALQRLA